MNSEKKQRQSRAVLIALFVVVIGTFGFLRFRNDFGTDSDAASVSHTEQAVIDALGPDSGISFKSNTEGHIVQLSAGGPEFSDSQASQLTALPHLRVLQLNESGITDKSLTAIGELTALETLQLEDTEVTGTGLSALTKLSALQHLSLANCTLGPDGVAPLAELKALQILDLRSTDLTDEGLRSLGGLSSLQRLYLGDTPISGEGLDAFQNHQSLEVLNLAGVAVNEKAIRALQGFPGLRQLMLSGTPVDDELLAIIVDVIVTSLPQLNGLSLSNTELGDSSTEILAGLKQAPELSLVGLESTPISKPAFVKLARETPDLRYMVDYPAGDGD